FSNHHFFVGTRDASQLRAAILHQLKRTFCREGFTEVVSEHDGDRHVVVGPAARWIFIGDSAGFGDSADSKAFDGLPASLSVLGPVVDICVIDDAAVHFNLYREGRLVDKFGTGRFPFYEFETEDESAPFRGRVELWAEFLRDSNQVGDLRSAWR